MKKGQSNGLWQTIEKDLRSYPVDKLWLADESNDKLGVLLFGEGIAAGRLGPLLSDLAPDFLSSGRPAKVICVPEVVRRVCEMRDELERWKRLSSIDPLTGLANFRHFREMLVAELDRVLRTKLPCALVMIDIDHFKAINDTHGHENGNQALKFVANVIKDQIRKIDFAARYGGEEFAVILPGTHLGKAVEVAKRLCAVVRDSVVQLDAVAARLTVSAGVAVCKADEIVSPELLIQRADEQLYCAKKQGRDRVCFRPSPQKEELCQVTVEERTHLFRLRDAVHRV